MRDFKEVPRLQRALEDMTLNPGGAVILGKRGRSWHGEEPPQTVALKVRLPVLP